MKKIVFICLNAILCLSASMSLSSCGDDDEREVELEYETGIIGTWCMMSIEPASAKDADFVNSDSVPIDTMIINSDGTYEDIRYNANRPETKRTGKYILMDNVFTAYDIKDYDYATDSEIEVRENISACIIYYLTKTKMVQRYHVASDSVSYDYDVVFKRVK